MEIIAVNKKHQSNVNKVVSWALKYSQAVNDYDVKNIDDNKRPKQERAYNMTCEYLAELPQREKQNINKTLDITGYFWDY